ncbi:S41 family peptidase [Amycolatopsis panacis]|uniref:S41 family peptidase n=1 Tax=Amycolatopsis panacis TaxID=2340917 RepID=UPI001F325D20|nr:S41 family peptidase [Amycolatopsis panacis]
MRILLAGLAALSVVAAPVNSTVDGVWRTDGYRQLIEVAGGKLTTYDVTEDSCLPGSVTGTGDGTTFAANEGLVATVDRRAGKLSFDGDLGVRFLHRLPALPAQCRARPSSDALSTFDIFWHTLAENYPFFAAKGVDWPAEGRAARQQVAAHPDRLYNVLCGLISPLHDAHVGLFTPDRRCTSLRPGTPDPATTIPRTVAVADANLDAPVRHWAGGGYADLPGGIGYLRIESFQGYTGTFAGDRAALGNALDEIFTTARISALHGLILDLRVNGGGADPLGLQVAARLTNAPHFAYAKRARNDPRDPARFTTPQPFFVRPAAGPRYPGPVAVLIGDLDASAGETFVQALLNRRPRPVLIGQPTQGVYSDTMERTLPRPGWRLAVPNEEYLDPQGRTYDGTGIGPDVPAPVFAPADLAAGRDPVLATARRLLG